MNVATRIKGTATMAVQNDAQDGDADERDRRAPVPEQVRTRTVQKMVIPGDARRRERRIPWLTLSGRWLEHAGFTPGMQVTILVKPRELTIRPATSGVADCPPSCE